MSSATSAVRLHGISKSYGPHVVVKPLSLSVEKGDFLAILGPSGCGKTTLLRMIGGFVEVSQGRVEVDGRDVTDLPPEARPTNMVFQSYGLFPHMNVRQNVAYGLKLRKLPQAQIDARVAHILSLVRLDKLAERMSGELSGGQQQRVAVARALVMEPPVLLLDEPFAALDLKLRHAMQDELKRIHREVGGTFVFVTHDQSEALALANRVAVMNEGAMEQIGTPEDVYLRPASRFVAGFIGEANVLVGERRAGRVTAQSGLTFDDDGADEPVALVVRPEHMRLNGEARSGEATLPGVIEDVTFFGSHVRYSVKLLSAERIRVHQPVSSTALAVGAGVAVSCPYSAVQPIGERRPFVNAIATRGSG